MALITKTDLVTKYNLPTEFDAQDDKRLDDPLAAAEHQMRELLTDTVYESIEAVKDNPDPGEETRKVNQAKRAEALLTLSYGLPDWNLRVGEQGGVLQSTGWEASRQNFMTGAQLDTYTDHLYHQAVQLISPYIPEPDTTTDEEADDLLDTGDMQMVVV